MILVTLFFLQSLPFSASAGILFTESKTYDLFGNVYTGTTHFYIGKVSNLYVGIAGDVLYKKSNVYANQYLQNPDLHLQLTSLSLGPSLSIAFNDNMGVGMKYRFNYVWTTYPEAAESSVVAYRTDGHTAGGADFFAYFTPLSFKGMRIGMETGLHLTTYGERQTYFEYPSELFDDLRIAGFAVKLMIAAW